MIAICVGSYYMYISPMWSDVDSLIAKKAEYENVLLKTKEIAQERDAAIASYNSIPQEDLDKLNKIVPETFNEAFVANTISSLAAKYGMSLSEFSANLPVTQERTDENSTDTTNDNKLYKTETIKLKLKGQFGQFTNFLNDLESSLHLMDIKNIVISANSGGKNPSDLNMEYDLDINTYSLK